MKDYKLSEIKEICSRKAICKTTCPLHNGEGCTVYALLKKYPSEWKIKDNKESNNEQSN